MQEEPTLHSARTSSSQSIPPRRIDLVTWTLIGAVAGFILGLLTASVFTLSTYSYETKNDSREVIVKVFSTIVYEGIAESPLTVLAWNVGLRTIFTLAGALVFAIAVTIVNRTTRSSDKSGIIGDQLKEYGSAVEANHTSRVVLAHRIVSVGMICVGLLFFARGTLKSGNGIYAAFGLSFTMLYTLGLFLKRKPWVFFYLAILVIIGVLLSLTFIDTLSPLVILWALLCFWWFDKRTIAYYELNIKKLTRDKDYITCSKCKFEQWSGYSECQKCGAKLS